MNMHIVHRMREARKRKPTHRSGTSPEPSTTRKMKAIRGDEVRPQDNILIMRFHEVLESYEKSEYESLLCVSDVVISRRLRTRQQRRTVHQGHFDTVSWFRACDL
jgi:hypothetical protein